jgi:exodeoxyribonuclease III
VPSLGDLVFTRSLPCKGEKPPLREFWPVQIATWNVNSVRQRLDHLLRYLRDVGPDVLCLQEIKCTDELFPREEIESAGYNVAVHGQKGFNGVAILSKTPMEAESGLAGDDQDLQARYIEAVVSTGATPIRVICLYLPNGNPPTTEKYAYKLAWMDRLIARAGELLRLEEPFVLAGDYNVIPAAADVYDASAWLGDALYLPQTRAKFQTLLNLGLTDALRACTDAAGLYTFWDYQAGAWQRNKGIRIDHLLLSPQAADRLLRVTIDKDRRGEDKPSDHVPVRIELRDETIAEAA